MTTTTSSLLLSSPGAEGFGMFRVSPEMSQVLKNHKVEVSKASLSSQFNDENVPAPIHQNQQQQQSTFLTTSNGDELLQKVSFKPSTTTIRPKPASCGIPRRNGKTIVNSSRRHIHPTTEMVCNMIQNQQRNRSLSFEIRDQRIDNAKMRRHNLRNYQLQRLEESLQRKEQQRLDHLTLKKKEHRQSILVTTIILVSTTYRWFRSTPEIISEFRYMKTLNDAARKIQNRWKNEIFLRRAMEARSIKKKLKKFSWRIRMWSQCARRRLNAQIIRQLFIDFSLHPLPYLIHKFYSKIIKAQKMIRSFIECKHARIVALELSWAELEKEMISEKIKHKRRKNALSDLMRGTDYQGMEMRHTFVHVVSEVLQRPNTATKEKPRDPNICRTLCRFHLEDSRRSHVKQAGVKQIRKGPSINRNHAAMLLAGEDFNLNIFPVTRSWPLFSLFHAEKDRLKATIKGEWVYKIIG